MELVVIHFTILFWGKASIIIKKLCKTIPPMPLVLSITIAKILLGAVCLYILKFSILIHLLQNLSWVNARCLYVFKISKFSDHFSALMLLVFMTCFLDSFLHSLGFCVISILYNILCFFFLMLMFTRLYLPCLTYHPVIWHSCCKL